MTITNDSRPNALWLRTRGPEVRILPGAPLEAVWDNQTASDQPPSAEQAATTEDHVAAAFDALASAVAGGLTKAEFAQVAARCLWEAAPGMFAPRSELTRLAEAVEAEIAEGIEQ